MLGAQPTTHASVRTVFTQALSSVAVLKLKPFVEACLDQRAERWDEVARSGEASIARSW